MKAIEGNTKIIEHSLDEGNPKVIVRSLHGGNTKVMEHSLDEFDIIPNISKNDTPISSAIISRN